MTDKGSVSSTDKAVFTQVHSIWSSNQTPPSTLPSESRALSEKSDVL